MATDLIGFRSGFILIICLQFWGSEEEHADNIHAMHSPRSVSDMKETRFASNNFLLACYVIFAILTRHVTIQRTSRGLIP